MGRASSSSALSRPREPLLEIERKRPPGDRRRVHDRRRRLPEDDEPVEDLLEIVHRAEVQLDEEAVLARDAVWGTALPDGLSKSGYVFDAMVLLYPPTVGDFDPQVAEWVVLVNSGWLE